MTLTIQQNLWFRWRWSIDPIHNTLVELVWVMNSDTNMLGNIIVLSELCSCFVLFTVNDSLV